MSNIYLYFPVYLLVCVCLCLFLHKPNSNIQQGLSDKQLNKMTLGGLCCDFSVGGTVRKDERLKRKSVDYYFYDLCI